MNVIVCRGLVFNRSDCMLSVAHGPCVCFVFEDRASDWRPHYGCNSSTSPTHKSGGTVPTGFRFLPVENQVHVLWDEDSFKCLNGLLQCVQNALSLPTLSPTNSLVLTCKGSPLLVPRCTARCDHKPLPIPFTVSVTCMNMLSIYHHLGLSSGRFPIWFFSKFSISF
jgi:hypothetical protein